MSAMPAIQAGPEVTEVLGTHLSYDLQSAEGEQLGHPRISRCRLLQASNPHVGYLATEASTIHPEIGPAIPSSPNQERMVAMS